MPLEPALPPPVRTTAAPRTPSALAPPASAPPADRREGTLPAEFAPLTVATWNIHSCVGVDARMAPDRTAAVIRDLDCDVVGLQEVGWHHRGDTGLDQFAFLERQTGFQAIAGPTKQNRLAHYGNALLTRLPVLASRTLDLSLPRREPRGAVAADLAAGGRVVRVVVAHLGLDPWERKAQVELLAGLLADAPGLPTLLMGDLNEWRPTAPRLRRLAERLPDCAAPRSFHARLPTLRLDRILVSPDLSLAAYDTVRTPLTRYASDHLPVRALIGVPRAQDG